MTFTPPGPGCWERDTAHFPRPVTPLCAEMFPAYFTPGFREGAKDCGLLLDYLEWQPVNGFMYMAPRPVGAPRGARKAPPRPLFALLSRAHPEMRRRIRRAGQIFTERPWGTLLAEWDTRLKPASVAEHLALLRVDPARLRGAELMAHIDACRAQLARMLRQRGRLTVPCLMPIGDFLVHAMEWTHLPPAALLRLLRGASPVSAGASAELERLAAAMRRSSAALRALDATPRDAISRLCAERGEVGEAVRAYVALVGHRVVGGYDVGDPSALEIPEMLVETIRDAVERVAVADADDEAARVRAAVPARGRERFDALLAEARSIYRLRDERGLFSDLWASGLLRRSILAAGTHLADAGRLAAPAHLLEAGHEEIRSLVTIGDGPSATELARRAAARAARHRDDVPMLLGPVFGGPPPAEWLPPAAARVARALDTIINVIFHESATGPETGTLYGLGASPGVYEGTARVVLALGELATVARGDVLVTTSTSPSFNVVLPMLGAIVTDFGGTLSHAAIVAREFGIPAVVGTREATRRLATGARVQVDGNAGEVRVVG